MSFHYTNHSHLPPQHPSPLTLPTPPFTLTAPPSTDIWRKPPSHSAFTAPILHQILPLHQFHTMRVTVGAEWQRQYDQGGLLFARPCAPSAAAATADGGGGTGGRSSGADIKWIKAGIELVDGAACASVVAAENKAADWSLVPLDRLFDNENHNNDLGNCKHECGKDESVGMKEGEELTIQFQRDKSSLWVYLVVQQQQQQNKEKGGGAGEVMEERKWPIRKVTWAFADDKGEEEEEGEEEVCWVGVYAARPTGVGTGEEEGEGDGGQGLEVRFRGLVIT